MKTMSDLKIRAFLNPYTGGNIRFFAHCCEGKTATAAQINMVPYEDGTDMPIFFSLPLDHSNAAQVLMDDLWACGIRPTEARGSAGAMNAMSNHLADMRRLVFDYTAIPKTEEKKIYDPLDS